MNYKEKVSAEIDKIHGEFDKIHGEINSLKREIDKLNEINYKLIGWIYSFCINYINHNENVSSKKEKEKRSK